MEKGISIPAGKMVSVVLTGPECTAKTTLAVQLAGCFKCRYVTEYARDYIENLDRSYTYDDVCHIAEVQLRQYREFSERGEGLVFFDTFLEITRVWFDVVYRKHPEWIDSELMKKEIDLYLLCDTDIPWEADGVRENGGEARIRLFHEYRMLLEQYGLPYSVISGLGDIRLQNAVAAVADFLRRSGYLM